MADLGNMFGVIRVIMQGSRIFCHRGSNLTLTTFFSVNEGKEDPNTIKSGQLSASQGNTIQKVFPWWADNVPNLNAVLNGVSLVGG